MSQTLSILERLIAFPTVSATSNLDIIEYITEFLNSRGFSMTVIHDKTGQKAGLFASIGPDGAGVMVSAHTDVVPVEGQSWSHDPFKLTREGDKVFGRGTTDMKGYVAAILALADRASKAPLKEPLKIALSYDEELGCLGIKRMIGDLESSIGLPRACIVGEPTEMAVAIGHKGKAALRADCYGLAGHSAMAPEFVNALYLASDFIGSLRVFQDELARDGVKDLAYDIPYSTLHAGKITGGIALNVVPDHAELVFEYRHLKADNPEMFQKRFVRDASAISEKYHNLFEQTHIDITQTMAYPGLDVAEEEPIVAYGKSLSQSNGVIKVPFGTEAGYFDQLGIPTIVCGPGSMPGQGHKPDEFIRLSELSACDAMMDRLLEDLCK